MHLLLVRHGESFLNLDEWTDGDVDTALTPLGKRQSAKLAAWLAQHVHVDALHASTMARALETAHYISEATGLPVIPDHRVRGIGHCRADGSPVLPEELPVVFPPDYWGTECPHTPISATGESWLLFRLRVGLFLDDMIKWYSDTRNNTEKTVVVVSHTATISATFDYIFNLGPHHHVKVVTPNTGIVHWHHRPMKPGREPWRLLGQGIAYHLVTDDGEWLGSRPMLSAAASG
jgi:probable phosphoglycerate mutase